MLVMAVIGGALVASASAIDESRTADIVASLPPDVDGTPPQVTVLDGLGWTERLDPAVPEEARAIAQVAAAVGSLGHTLDELSVVAALYDISPGNAVAITAWRLDGVQAIDLAMPILRATYGADAELATKVRVVGESEVIRVRDLTVPGAYPRTLQAVDDVVWIIDAEEPYLGAVLATLPASTDGRAPALLFEPVGDSTWRITEPDRGCRTWTWGEAFGSADGMLWFADDAGVRLLGECEILGIGGSSMFTARDAAMAPDGTLWVLDDSRLLSWGGEEWVVRLEGFNASGSGTCSPERRCYFHIEVAPDGTIWLGGSTVSSFDGTEWQHYLDGSGGWVSVGLDGSVWILGNEAPYVIRPGES
jgi:hypothetical protein